LGTSVLLLLVRLCWVLFLVVCFCGSSSRGRTIQERKRNRQRLRILLGWHWVRIHCWSSRRVVDFVDKPGCTSLEL